jgi:carbon monoxide dehydrogenase subunit G
MRCSCDVSVDEPVDRIWASLADVDNSLASIPGGTLSRDGDTVSGSLKCVLGAAQVTYRLTARAEAAGGDPHSAVIAVTGKEARGTGTLAATLTVAAHEVAAGSRLEVNADIEVTGRGAAVLETEWTGLLTKLVDAAVWPQPVLHVMANEESPAPPAAQEQSANPVQAVPPRPALAVAPAQGESAAAPAELGEHRRLIYGVLAAGMLLVVRRRRARRRRGGEAGSA